MAPSPPSMRGRPQEPNQKRNTSAVKSLEDQIRYSYFVPPPGAYDPHDPHKPDYSEPRRGGKISDAQVPSTLDHMPRTKNYVPGPGSYARAQSGFALPEGGRLNRNAPKKTAKLVDEAPIPAPGDYGVPGNPANPRVLHGRFSKQNRAPEYIQKEVRRSRGIPGPGTHDVHGSMEALKPFCPEGGRCLGQSKPVNFIDNVVASQRDKPGPDAYTLPGGVEDKAVGRLVYRYESATMKETKAMVQKAIGESQQAPGPGAYDVPEPAPLNSAPTMKSRNNAAMPHPFAYNCQPDHCNRFSANTFTPVRQQNNAGLIFGNGVRPEDQARRARKSSSQPSSPAAAGLDQVQHQELPPPLQGIDEESEDTVQWRAGGFSSLKKSKSTGAMQRVDHPSVEEAKLFYPSLAAKNRGRSNTFRPMASKRSEAVSLGPAAEEGQRLQGGKWKLAAVADGIQNTINSALEPLDLDKLKEDAMKGLRDKAKARMKLEGVSKEQQNLVLEELTAVLDEHRQASRTRREQQAGATLQPVGGEESPSPDQAMLMLAA